MIDEGKSKKDEVRLPVIASPQIEAIHAGPASAVALRFALNDKERMSHRKAAS